MTVAALADPHRGAVVSTFGAPLAEARAAVLLVHGRGREDVLG